MNTERQQISDCFDTNLAGFPIRRVAVSQIRDLLAATHATEHIERYGQAMRRGERFPPISVLALGHRYVIADGHKRFSAYRALGFNHEILVEVWTLRRLLCDLSRQASRSFARKKLLASMILGDTKESARLLGSTYRHWRRIAISLLTLVRPERARKLCLEDLPVVHKLRGGSRAIAELEVVDHRGQSALLKTFRHSSPLFRTICGAWMCRREAAAYNRIGPLQGVPRLLGRVGRDGLLLEFIAGHNCRDAGASSIGKEFFDELVELLKKVRARGVLHGDVKRNVLVGAGGRPVLVDFGASFVIRWWLWPLRSFILRSGAQYDRRSVVELKRLLAPGMLTRSDRDVLEQRLPLADLVSLGQRSVRGFSAWMIRRTEKVASLRSPVAEQESRRARSSGT